MSGDGTQVLMWNAFYLLKYLRSVKRLLIWKSTRQFLNGKKAELMLNQFKPSKTWADDSLQLNYRDLSRIRDDALLGQCAVLPCLSERFHV
jgi:hypothetical protein